MFFAYTRGRRLQKKLLLLLAVTSVTAVLFLCDSLNICISLNEYELDGHRQKATYLQGRPLIVKKVTVQSGNLSRLVNDSMQSRLELVRQKCAAGWQPNYGHIFRVKNTFYYDARRKLGYCHAAKAGCTFWLRVFSYLTRRSELKQKGIESPFSIKRVDIHTGTLSPKTVRFWRQFEKDISKRAFRFMFARNPYSRLFSVYLDKFYLLGFSQTQVFPLLCDKSKWGDFDLFLELALALDDHHLIPISELCNPCQFQPHAIGKMETFKRDANFILDRGNYGWVLRHFTRSLYVDVEIESIIFENFAFLQDIISKHGNDCLGFESLSRRLWAVFQYNGFIPSNVSFPNDGLPSYSVDDVIKFFKETVRNHSMDADESLRQRNSYLSTFYANISQSKIRQIQERYKGDFEMFGYSLEVPSVS